MRKFLLSGKTMSCARAQPTENQKPVEPFGGLHLRSMALSAARMMLHRLGLDIVKYRKRSKEPPLAYWEVCLGKLLVAHQVDLVLDVGANVGQYASSLFRIGFEGRVVSFEPLAAAYHQLLERSLSNPKWEVAERCALGDRTGEISLNVANNSVSSSALPMLKSHQDAAPDSVYIGAEITKLVTLDSVADEYIRDARCPFLKLDVQGYEETALRGATETLSKVVGIQLEMSLVPLYQGELPFRQMLDRISARGFELQLLIPGFSDPDSGRLLQVDGIFFRPLPAQQG